MGLDNPQAVKVNGKRGANTASLLVSTSDHIFVEYQRITLRRLKDGETARLVVNITKPTQHILISLMSNDFGKSFFDLDVCFTNFYFLLCEKLVWMCIMKWSLISKLSISEVRM
jgi:hypothetical protein